MTIDRKHNIKPVKSIFNNHKPIKLPCERTMYNYKGHFPTSLTKPTWNFLDIAQLNTRHLPLNRVKINVKPVAFLE